jgi:hypothetical protein
MPTPSRTALIATLLVVVLVLFAASSILFAAQGGFGRGHGRFDRALFVLGLPWMAVLVLIPWTESLWLGDYAMIVLLPLVCNLAVVLLVWALLKRRQDS